jgi:hypothetical protein
VRKQPRSRNSASSLPPGHHAWPYPLGMFKYMILFDQFKCVSLTIVDQIEPKWSKATISKFLFPVELLPPQKAATAFASPVGLPISHIYAANNAAGSWIWELASIQLRYRRITPTSSKRKFCVLRIQSAHRVSILIGPMGLVISLIHSFKSSIRDLLIMPQVAIWCAPALDCNPHVKHVYGHRRRMVYLMASVGSSSSDTRSSRRRA